MCKREREILIALEPLSKEDFMRLRYPTERKDRGRQRDRQAGRESYERNIYVIVGLKQYQ